MKLYRKGGGPPQPLPSVAYAEGVPFTDLENNPAGLAACGWAPAPEPPPFDPFTEALTWDSAAEAWVVGPLPAAPPPPLQIRKYWLFERFTEDQERLFAKLEYQATNLTPAELDDPANERLFQLQRALRRLGALSVVELNADQTLQFFELLRQLGVFGDPENPASHAALLPILAAPAAHEAP